jgi:uncharacterized repeat protein (TIGR04042 family)
MPELHFSIEWPDGTTETCYSPSTIVRDHFANFTSYGMAEFLARSRAALTAASERVRERYGAPCSLALGQLARIEAAASRFSAESVVVFKSFKE